MNSDERAYELLKWQALVQVADFSESVNYAAVQKQRSDAALDAWDEEHPYETSDELKAFHCLERLGIFNQSDYYSPTKSKDGYYTERLKAHQHQTRGEGRSNTRTGHAAGARRYGHQ